MKRVAILCLTFAIGCSSTPKPITYCGFVESPGKKPEPMKLTVKEEGFAFQFLTPTTIKMVVCNATTKIEEITPEMVGHWTEALAPKKAVNQLPDPDWWECE